MHSKVLKVLGYIVDFFMKTIKIYLFILLNIDRSRISSFMINLQNITLCRLQNNINTESLKLHLDYFLRIVVQIFR